MRLKRTAESGQRRMRKRSRRQFGQNMRLRDRPITPRLASGTTALSRLGKRGGLCHWRFRPRLTPKSNRPGSASFACSLGGGGGSEKEKGRALFPPTHAAGAANVWAAPRRD